jgi:putative Mg2+ transporter-C (MgtC) family protein
MPTLKHILDLLGGEMGAVASPSVVRVITAAVLGGIIGLEREFKHKPAGLRTNMFICLGSAMFTILSDQLAAAHPGDHTRIAAQIIPGIGFIGAGSILHARGSVTGLTTAATIFVVASVGMAVGGGLYLTAAFETGVVLIALYVLGQAEDRFALKSKILVYEATGARAEDIIGELNRILDELKLTMQHVRIYTNGGYYQVHFHVEASHSEHERLGMLLRQSSIVFSVSCLGPVERE